MSFESIWKTEHTNFNPDENGLDFIYVNNNIREYLHKNNSNKFFLVGRKGVGKSLLLAYKSHLFREKYFGDSYKYVPKSKSLVESLAIDYESFSKDQLIKFQDIKIWKSIWTFILLFIVCKSQDLDIEEDITSIVPRKNITTILSLILENRNDFRKYTKYNGTLLDLASEIQSGVAVFIDNLDQTFEDILKIPHASDWDYTSSSNPTVLFWMNIQIGMMVAIYEINKSNPHIKIYTTVRQEAFNRYKGQQKQNLREYSTTLSYTKAEIKEIFLNRIAETEEYKNTERENLIKAFIGFDKMKHPFALNKNKDKRIEDVFDFLFRHTYGRPREILTFGKRIRNVLTQPDYEESNLETNRKKIRLAINDESYNVLFKDYKNEIIPDFSDIDFYNFIQKLEKNIFSKGQSKNLNPQLFKFYYNLGLVGYIEKSFNNIDGHKHIQVFKPTSSYDYSDLNSVPNSDYYFTHPTVDKAFEKHNKAGFEDFYDRSNIIGDGYGFEYPISKTIKRPVEDFYPTLPGTRWDRSSEKSRNQLPMKDYYQYFFSNCKQQIEEYSDEAISILNNLARTKYYNYLYKKSGIKTYKIQRDQFLQEILQDPEFAIQQRMLGNKMDRKTINDFKHRLYSRLIAIGAYLYLDLSCWTIHSLFNPKNDIKFNWDKDHLQSETHIKYLSTRFYIDALISDKSSDNEIIKSKSKIFSSCSIYEQHILIRWHDDFIHNIETDESLIPENIAEVVNFMMSLKKHS